MAFRWKRIGTACQNERETHLILQMMKDCFQVVAPGVLFIAEAIVAPVEIIKYFGEDAMIAKECEIAYNATFMALLWDAVATKNAGALASLAGLEQALERQDPEAIDRSIDLILTLHGMVLAFGGIPLLWYGDELGTFNDNSFLTDPNKAGHTPAQFNGRLVIPPCCFYWLAEQPPGLGL